MEVKEVVSTNAPRFKTPPSLCARPHVSTTPGDTSSLVNNTCAHDNKLSACLSQQNGSLITEEEDAGGAGEEEVHRREQQRERLNTLLLRSEEHTSELQSR